MEINDKHISRNSSRNMFARQYEQAASLPTPDSDCSYSVDAGRAPDVVWHSLKMKTRPRFGQPEGSRRVKC